MSRVRTHCLTNSTHPTRRNRSLPFLRAGAATTHPHATIPVAIFGAVVYHLAYRYQYNWGIDDAVNAAPVHLWCGIWGTIAASLCYSFKFRNTYFDLMETRGYDIDHGGEEDCGRGGQLLANVIFAIVTVLWVGIHGTTNIILRSLCPREQHSFPCLRTQHRLSVVSHVKRNIE